MRGLDLLSVPGVPGTMPNAILGGGGYRGLNPVTSIGRAGIDFSNYPGGGLPMGLAQNQIGVQVPMGPKKPPLAPAGPLNQGQQPVLPPVMG